MLLSNKTKNIQYQKKTKEHMSNIVKVLLKKKNKSRKSLWILINLKEKVRNLLLNTFWNHPLAHTHTTVR